MKSIVTTRDIKWLGVLYGKWIKDKNEKVNVDFDDPYELILHSEYENDNTSEHDIDEYIVNMIHNNDQMSINDESNTDTDESDQVSVRSVGCSINEKYIIDENTGINEDRFSTLNKTYYNWNLL